MIFFQCLFFYPRDPRAAFLGSARGLHAGKKFPCTRVARGSLFSDVDTPRAFGFHAGKQACTRVTFQLRGHPVFLVSRRVHISHPRQIDHREKENRGWRIIFFGNDLFRKSFFNFRRRTKSATFATKTAEKTNRELGKCKTF